MSNFQITVQAIDEPLTLEEAKLHLRVDGADEDTIIQDYIKAARLHMEKFTGLSFAAQTVKAVFDVEKPTDPYNPHRVKPISELTFELPLSPVDSILTVTDGTNPLTHTVDLDFIPARIKLDTQPDKLVVTYTTLASEYSTTLKIAHMMLVHGFYEARGMIQTDALMRVEEAYLRPVRVLRGFA